MKPVEEESVLKTDDNSNISAAPMCSGFEDSSHSNTGMKCYNSSQHLK